MLVMLTLQTVPHGANHRKKFASAFAVDMSCCHFLIGQCTFMDLSYSAPWRSFGTLGDIGLVERSRTFRWFVWASLAAIFVVFILPELLPNGPRWYFLNPRYALWTAGMYPYNQRVVYEGLNGDLWRDDVVRGKTVPELRQMFHDIRDISEFDVYSLAKVSSETNSTCTFVKWGDTAWFIEVTNGKASSINLWKG